MATERVLSNLNLISFKTEGGLQNHIDELQDGDLAFTPDNSLKGVLFDFKWADHLLNDMSWLRADTFSWQSGDVYVAAYEHLVTDFENAEVNHWYAWTEIGGGIWYTKTPTVAVGDTVYNDDFTVFGQVDTVYSETNFTIGANDFNRSASNDITVGDTETIAGIEITFYRAEDKHKICLPDQEDKVLALYNATGVAWYYILDTANKQFKLPRTKYGFTGLRDEVGGYIEPGIPNLKGMLVAGGLRIDNGDFFQNGTSTAWYGDNIHTYVNNSVEYDASNVSPVYNDSNTVQPPATQMYLYFYVGNFERDAVEQTAGVTTETLNGKADSDLKNIPANYDYVVESQMPTEANGYTWYRKYKSGWVEQGQTTLTLQDSATTYTLPIEMESGNYDLFFGFNQSSDGTTMPSTYDRTTTTFSVNSPAGNVAGWWRVSGMSAQ